MNLTLLRLLLGRRLRSLPRSALVLTLTGIHLAQVVLSGESTPLEGQLAGMAALSYGAGMLGQEWKEGSLAVLLCRPVSRSGLALGGWLAAAWGGLSAWAAGNAASLGLAVLPGVELNWSAASLAEDFLIAAAAAVGMGALAAAFGVLGRGMSGAAVHLVLLITVVSLAQWGREAGHAVLHEISKQVLGALLPIPDVASWLVPRGWSWFEFLSWASDVSLLLAAACWLLGRAQIGYAHEE